MDIQWVPQLIFNLHTGIESSSWILKHHRDDATNLSAVSSGALRNLAALEEHLTRSRCLQPTHDVSRCGFARSGLTDQTDGLPLEQGQADILNRFDIRWVEDRSRASPEGDINVAQLNDRCAVIGMRLERKRGCFRSGYGLRLLTVFLSHRH